MTKSKVMFEIYRESEYNRLFHVVYFTELNEHNKEYEINRAMAGEHFIDGFFYEDTVQEAKNAIQGVVDALNRGESLTPSDAASMLGGVLVN